MIQKAEEKMKVSTTKPPYLPSQKGSALPNNLPILPRSTRRRHRGAAHLRAALGVHPRRALLCVCECRETHVRELRAEVTVVALVHDERVAGDRFGVDLVRVQEVDELGLRLRGARRGHKADIVCCGTGSHLKGAMQSHVLSGSIGDRINECIPVGGR
jgi:hypothetical protein